MPSVSREKVLGPENAQPESVRPFEDLCETEPPPSPQQGGDNSPERMQTPWGTTNPAKRKFASPADDGPRKRLRSVSADSLKLCASESPLASRRIIPTRQRARQPSSSKDFFRVSLSSSPLSLRSRPSSPICANDPLMAPETLCDLGLDDDGHEESGYENDHSDEPFPESQLAFAAELSGMRLNAPSLDSVADFAAEMCDLNLDLGHNESHEPVAADRSDSEDDTKDKGDGSDTDVADHSDCDEIEAPSKSTKPLDSPTLVHTPVQEKGIFNVSPKSDLAIKPMPECTSKRERVSPAKSDAGTKCTPEHQLKHNPENEYENASTRDIKGEARNKSVCESKVAKNEPLCELRPANVNERTYEHKRESTSLCKKVEGNPRLDDLLGFTAEILDKHISWDDQAVTVDNMKPVCPRSKELKYLVHGKDEIILAHFKTDINRELQLRDCRRVDWLVQHQQPFNQVHRGTVVCWLAEMAEEQDQDPSSYHLAVTYFDIFMAKTMNYDLDQLQLIGVAMLDLAARSELHRSLDLKKVLHYELQELAENTLAYENHYNRLMSDIADFEIEFLLRMDGSLIAPTSHDFLARSLRLASLQEAHYDPQWYNQKGKRNLFEAHLHSTTSEECTRVAMELLHGCIVIYESRRFAGSLLAAAVFHHVFSGKRGFGTHFSDPAFVTKLTRDCTGYTEEQLVDTKALHLVRRIATLIEEVRENPRADEESDLMLIPRQRQACFDPSELLLRWDPRLEHECLREIQ
ncbi:Cyclin-A1-2 [Geranomyces variabilis]|nr:Cyclin-A1-2 [Geranomyces variabilis]